jgi:demethylmenaquinone methyltransferase / 2-methoxy-6-polyprenyl-1,4-benzoquinol methylase
VKAPGATPLVQGEEKRAMVRAMFDSVAPRYDIVNRVISCGLDGSWRKRTIRALGLARGSRVLDIACGTGDLCRLLSDRGMKPVGLDMSDGMLRRNRSGAPLLLADALAMPFRDASFDGAVSGFALRNFTGIPPFIEQLARIVRPGGRICLLDVSQPTSAIARAGYRVWFEHAVPAIGGLVSDSDAYKYLPASVEYLPPPDRIRAMLRDAGFASVGRRTFSAGTTQLFTATRAGNPADHEALFERGVIRDDGELAARP